MKVIERAKRQIVEERTKKKIGTGREVAEVKVAKGKKDARVLQNIPHVPTLRMPPDILTVAGHGPATLRTTTEIVSGIKKKIKKETGSVKETGIGTDGETTDTERETETPKEEMNVGEIEMKILGNQAVEKGGVQKGAEKAVTEEIERKRW